MFTEHEKVANPFQTITKIAQRSDPGCPAAQLQVRLRLECKNRDGVQLNVKAAKKSTFSIPASTKVLTKLTRQLSM